MTVPCYLGVSLVRSLAHPLSYKFLKCSYQINYYNNLRVRTPLLSQTNPLIESTVRFVQCSEACAPYHLILPVSVRTIYSLYCYQLITDFRLSRWLIIGVNSGLRLLHRVVVGDVAKISEVHDDEGRMYLRNVGNIAHSHTV
jgi:hypothetical protein